jgi:hypothetical protein
LESVLIDGQAEQFAELMTAPTLCGLRQLALNRAGSEELQAIADSPALDTLQSLHIRGRDSSGTVEAPVLRRLFSSPRLGSLRELRVWIDRAGDTLGFVIGGSPYLRNLETLELSDAMRDEAARDLFDSPNMANMTTLLLLDNPIGDVAIRELVRSKHLTQLTTLRLSGALLTAESGHLLAGWPGLRTLTQLFLDDNELGREGIEALSRSPHLGQLRLLAISTNVPDTDPWWTKGLPGFAHIPNVF